MVALSFGEQLAAFKDGRLQHDFICGLVDCAAVASARKEREQSSCRRAVLAEATRRERREGKSACKSETGNLKPELRGRKMFSDSEDDFSPSDAKALAALTQLPPVRPLVQQIVVPEKALSALDFESSANGRLLEFFKLPKNFEKWFAAKWLEDEVGRTSGRMNNRAIWLRAQFNVAGLELDQHGCPPGENLPNGSYYRLCRIEDALRLSDAQKYKLTHPEPEML
jgi:hypothetical protein